MNAEPRSRAAGFSLLELMVAMMITLIVSGAIYGLLSSGQSAFRREPELTDRQQNIRVGMDLITRDIQKAGVGMGSYTQTLIAGGDNVGILSPTAGQKTDQLEIIANDGACPDAPVTSIDGANLDFLQALPGCYGDNQFVLVIYGMPGQPERGAKWGLGHVVHAGGEKLNFPPGLNDAASGSQIQSNCDKDYFCSDGGTCTKTCTPTDNTPPIRILHGSRYLWVVRNDTDGIPCLWRSASGDAVAAIPGGGWQNIARGIEDLQIQYRTLNGAWVDNAPAVVDGFPATIIAEVKVTLSARTISLRGTASAVGSAVRGQLTSVVALRSALYYLHAAGLWY